MTKVDLITGFLGAGKTTLLLKYAGYLMKKGLRIGIMEYDYSAVNVDLLLLGKLRGPQCELEMIDAACDRDSLKRRFRTKLIAMAMSGYDRILIEPSGVFDMDIFFDVMRDEPLDRLCEIGSVLTVVQGNLICEHSREEQFYLASQAVDAGMVILSHVQECSEAELLSTLSYLQEAAESIYAGKIKGKILQKCWDELTEDDFESMMEAGYHICDYMKVTAGKESAFSSVCFLNVPEDVEALKEKIRVLFQDAEYGTIRRVKGFLLDKGVPHQVNATRYEMKVETGKIGQNAVIVIGENLNADKIKSLLVE